MSRHNGPNFHLSWYIIVSKAVKIYATEAWDTGDYLTHQHFPSFEYKSTCDLSKPRYNCLIVAYTWPIKRSVLWVWGPDNERITREGTVSLKMTTGLHSMSNHLKTLHKTLWVCTTQVLLPKEKMQSLEGILLTWLKYLQSSNFSGHSLYSMFSDILGKLPFSIHTQAIGTLNKR